MFPWWLWAAIAYLMALLVAWRIVAGHIAYEKPIIHGRKANWSDGTGEGLIVVFFWPVTCAFLLAELSTRAWPKVLQSPVERRGHEAERELAKKELERENERAEQAHGIVEPDRRLGSGDTRPTRHLITAAIPASVRHDRSINVWVDAAGREWYRTPGGHDPNAWQL